MSPTIFRPAGPIPQAAILALGMVAAPELHAQNGGRALLNAVSLPTPVTFTDASAPPVSSERVLLGRVPLANSGAQAELMASDTLVHLIDGATALLGRPATMRTRRSLAAKRR